MPKRKLATAEEPEPTPRRSGRLQKSEHATATENVSVKAEVKDKQVKPALYWFASGLSCEGGSSVPQPPRARSRPFKSLTAPQSEPLTKKGRAGKQPTKTKKTAPGGKAANSSTEKPESQDAVAAPTSKGTTAADGERNYWLLKAEPESRFENGIDVKFSIDDLAARTKPEPWDGMETSQGNSNRETPRADARQESAPTQPATTSAP